MMRRTLLALLTTSALLGACNADDTSKTEDVAPTAPQTEPVASPEPVSDPEFNADNSIDPVKIDKSPEFHTTENWSGEYPNGLAVYAEGVSVPGYEVIQTPPPNPGATPDSDCKLDYLGNYHPWNADRIKQDGLKFVTVNETQDFPLTVDFEFTYYDAATENTTPMRAKVGDSVTYMGYLSEGYSLVSFKNTLAAVQLDTLNPDAYDLVKDLDSWEWIAVPCVGKPHWVSVDQIKGINGIQFGPQEGNSYGFSTDLTEEQAEQMRKNAP